MSDENNESNDDLITRTERLAHEIPDIIPFIEHVLELATDADVPDPNAALACFRLHYQHPTTAAMIVNLAAAARMRDSGANKN